MYNLPHYKEKDPKVIKDFIRQNPFAFLTGSNANHEPVATQVPVFIEEEEGKQFLRGHIMKNTAHHKAFLQNENVLAVFTGKHTYVSATWYSNPHTASTWNYMSVHAKGKIRFLDETALIKVLQMTSLHFENDNSDSSTTYDNLSKEYTQKLMKAIVAFEIEIVELNHVFKLSQDRDFKSYQNIIKKLYQQDHDGQIIAEEMKKRIQLLFPEEF